MEQDLPDPGLLDLLNTWLRLRTEAIANTLGLYGTHQEQLLMSYDLTFSGHQHAPNRASGEPYLLHPFRQLVRMALRILKFGVTDPYFIKLLLCVILLHDTVEDALKGKTTPFVAYSKICTLLDELTAYSVLSLTKKKSEPGGGESREEFLERVLRNDQWVVLVAKPEDMIDNLSTLQALPLDKQPGKIREALTYGPRMKERAERFIVMAGKGGNLSDWEGWLQVVADQHAELEALALKERRRVALTGYRFNF